MGKLCRRFSTLFDMGPQKIGPNLRERGCFVREWQVRQEKMYGKIES